MINFEIPLSEKIRFFLRVEKLYSKALYFISNNFTQDHQIALKTIFDLYDLTSRSDVKSDLMQELEKQKLTFEAFHKNPNVDTEKTEEIIKSIDSCNKKLYISSGKTGQGLKNNELLLSIKQKTSIPGGICEFDMPAYQHWSSLPSKERTLDLKEWLLFYEDVFKGVKLILNILRNNKSSADRVAFSGNYHQSLNGKILHLLNISYDVNNKVLPEVSHNKYVLNIRFLNLESKEIIPRSKTDKDINFSLTFCNLNKRFQ